MEIDDALASLKAAIKKNDEVEIGRALDDIDTFLESVKEIEDETEEGQKAEWTAAVINDLPDSSFAYVEPGGKKDDQGKTTPRSLRHFPYKGADGEVDLPHLRNALARAPQSPFGDKAMPALRVAAAAKKVGEAGGKEIVGSFQAFKEANGVWRWITATTNKFQDREKETFTEEAHKEAVDYATAFKSYPELRLWHIPGSTIGRGDYAAYLDGFVLHSGAFDPGMGGVAEYLASRKDLGVSQGYKYRAVDRLDKVYEWYRTFEVSVLPAARAANAWGEFQAAVARKEMTMPLTEEKRKFLVEAMGEEKTKGIEAYYSELSKALEEAGVDFKDLVDEAAPATSEKPAEEAVEEKPSALTADDVRAIVQEAVAPLVAEQKATKEDITALKRTDDEKVAAAIAPKRQAPGNGGGPANSDTTKVDGTTQEELAAAAKEEDPDEGDPALAPYLATLRGRTAS